MPLLHQISVFILGLALGVQIFSRPFLVRRRKWFWWGSAVIICAGALFLVWTQYRMWAAGEPGKFLLPPYRSIGYFFSYVGHRIFGQWLLSFLAGALGGYAAYRLNRRYGLRFFEDEEPWLFAMGILLAGYPGFLFYIPLVFLVGVLLTLAYTILRKGRAPLYWLWLPLAIFAILITNWYVPKEILVKFNL